MEAWFAVDPIWRFCLSYASCWCSGSILVSNTWSGWFEPFYNNDNYFCHWIRWIQWKHLGKTQQDSAKKYQSPFFKLLDFSNTVVQITPSVHVFMFENKHDVNAHSHIDCRQCTIVKPPKTSSCIIFPLLKCSFRCCI